MLNIHIKGEFKDEQQLIQGKTYSKYNTVPGRWHITICFQAVIVCIMILTWTMTFLSIGGFANIFNAITQVPQNAKIFNYGMHSYWIK